MDDFQTYQPLLFSIAYRMTGSASQAEDIVQDAYLQYQRTDATTIQTLKAYLSTTVVHLSINYLKSAHVEREQYIGVWLPEPVLTSADDREPLTRIEQQEAVSLAFLVLLEALTPPERAVFVLHKAFDYSFSEVAEMIGKSTENCRQLFHRAKSHLTEKHQRFAVASDTHRQLTASFLAACQSGNLATLTELLASDAIAWADGGGKIKAALSPISGRETVARLFIVLTRKITANHLLSIEEINGSPALISWSGAQLNWVLALDISGKSIVGLRSILNPDKLTFLQSQLQKRYNALEGTSLT